MKDLEDQLERGSSGRRLTRYFPDFLVNMSASADVLAQAKVEVGLGAIPEGKNVCHQNCELSVSVSVSSSDRRNR